MPHNFVYGYCPECGAPGVRRERCPNGNDECEAGHSYPSRDSVNEPSKARRSPNARLADISTADLLAEIGRRNPGPISEGG